MAMADSEGGPERGTAIRRLPSHTTLIAPIITTNINTMDSNDQQQYV